MPGVFFGVAEHAFMLISYHLIATYPMANYGGTFRIRPGTGMGDEISERTGHIVRIRLSSVGFTPTDKEKERSSLPPNISLKTVPSMEADRKALTFDHDPCRFLPQF